MKTFNLCALAAGACFAAACLQPVLAQSASPSTLQSADGINGIVALPYMTDRATADLPANVAKTVGSVSILEVRPDVYMLTVGGNNLAVYTGGQGSIVIDSGGGNCDDVIAAVNSVEKAPARFIILTGADADRVGCSGALSKAGQKFPFQPGPGAGGPRTREDGAEVTGLENVITRMVEQTSLPSTASVPTVTYTRSTMGFGINHKSVELVSMPAAHSDADSVVVLPGSDLVVAGNVFDNTRFPVIDIAHGGSIQGEIDALNRLLTDITVGEYPRWQGYFGTLVIPARGHLCDHDDLVFYRDMVTIIRDRVASLLSQGKTLAQVQAADPTRGYAARYGSNDGSWTTRDFVAAVYNSLQAQRRGTHKRG
jgi:glyoxylase-like metal-dependent hydrolase (beta-lactamase superfamily II)